MAAMDQSIETRYSGEFKFDPTKWRYTSATLGLFAFIGCLVGLFLGVTIEASPANIILAIGFAIAVKVARDTAIGLEREHIKALQSSRLEELAIAKEQGKLVSMRLKEEQSPGKKAFTSDDFTDEAANLLIPIVRSARKSGVKITGQGLITEFLKRMH